VAATGSSGNRWTGRRRFVLAVALAAASVLAAAAALSCYTVDAGEYALVTEFGKPIKVVTEPGLQFKYPYQSVRSFDARLFASSPASTEFLTLEKTPVVAASTILWRIGDPKKFFQTVFDRTGAESRLGDVLFAEMGAAVGRNPLAAFYSVEPGQYRVDAILADVTARCREVALRDFGIEVVDVELRAFDFPKQNRGPLYARMKSERGRLSMKYRSEGEEEGLKVRATADQQKSQLLSEALKIAQQHRGKGEAEAAHIYSAALGQGPDFYQFMRTMEASHNLVPKGTTLVLPANSELFGLLSDSNHYDRHSGTRRVSHPRRKE
jgi:membrane protease subunit HflC